ncbi:hypothetical protein BSLG_008966 [Batrachochytrium salamandrivorans]|nr:hypothetical protein BSLG_008966 [Batrachochytrium salamandrivorans]
MAQATADSDIVAAAITSDDDYEKHALAYLLSLEQFELCPLRPGQQPATPSEAKRLLSHTLRTDKALFLGKQNSPFAFIQSDDAFVLLLPSKLILLAIGICNAFSLEKWGRFLSRPLLDAFPEGEGDYETSFYLNHLKKKITETDLRLANTARSSSISLVTTHSIPSKQIRNRRLQYLTQLANVDDDYLSINAMRDREPEIYQNSWEDLLPMKSSIGRFRMRCVCTSNLRDQDETSMDENGAPIIEYDSDHDPEDIVGKLPTGTTSTPHLRNATKDTTNCIPYSDETVSPEDVTLEDRKLLSIEFSRIMRERFIDGLDDTFDYSVVDDNDAYDNLDAVGADAEDQYFDSESPS